MSKTIENDRNSPKNTYGGRMVGPNIYALPYPDYVNSRLLAGGVAESISVPSWATIVIFSATEDFFVSYSGAATVPGDKDDGSANELNPVQRDISGLSTISVISPSACRITAAFYKSEQS